MAVRDRTRRGRPPPPRQLIPAFRTPRRVRVHLGSRVASFGSNAPTDVPLGRGNEPRAERSVWRIGILVAVARPCQCDGRTSITRGPTGLATPPVGSSSWGWPLPGSAGRPTRGNVRSTAGRTAPAPAGPSRAGRRSGPAGGLPPGPRQPCRRPAPGSPPGAGPNRAESSARQGSAPVSPEVGCCRGSCTGTRGNRGTVRQSVAPR
jgi:hypothetical protein